MNKEWHDKYEAKYERTQKLKELAQVLTEHM